MKTTQLNPDYLPTSIQELIEVVGLAAALVIVAERGGVRLCVPAQAAADHWLAPLIGLPALTALVERYRGEEIDIARCVAALRAVQEQQIASEAAAGVSNASLARRYGYTERGIRKLRRRAEDELTLADRQGQLFASETTKD
ncbi:Mor transcription activator family protein [Candidatus Vondammii sp. HM_W22]|uniref:Mor transcription activator family protein n=1 Tax=Candidatus Vondammii sp. HM_W22 TaxID=2687299 RepID=UPI001F13E040|nr:Mor transcription activator family protein [Candidatus Vondammii sp. HM_W22]